MHRIGSQKGEGKAGCLFWLLVLAIAVLIGARMIPVKIATMQLEDYMEELAMTEARRSQSFFEREIAARALQLDLPIPKDQIRVKKLPNRVIMDVQFIVPLDFVVYQHNWKIKIRVDRDIYLF